MWLFQEQNHLPSSSSLKRWGLPQQLKPRSNCRMCSTTDIHRCPHISWSGGPLQKVPQGVCVHSAAPQWVSCWGRGQQEVRVGVAYRGGHKGFQSIETGVHDSSLLGVQWLHQTVPVGDWCIPRWIGGIVVTEAGRWVVPPHCPW